MRPEAVHAVGAENVLVAAPDAEDRERDLCGRLLAEPTPDSIVGVTTKEPPGPWLSAHIEEPPASMDATKVICVGEQAQPDDPTAAQPVAVTDPGNLTELGSLLSVHLTDGFDDPVLCLDSLSTLFQHSETETVFQFLHVLTDLVSANASQAHYHLDPSAHDDQTVASVKLLVDAVITVSADGIDVETR